MAILLFGLGIGLVAVHMLLVALVAPRAALRRSTSVLVTGAVGVYLTAWFSTALTFGDPANFPLADERLRLPVSLAAAFGPMLLAIVLLFTSSALHRVNAAMPSTWLIWAQTYRMAGLMFLFPHLYYGIVPAGFAIPAGIGDFLTGALAPFVARAVARQRPHAIRWAIAWNAFGVLDLIVAPLAAVLSHAQVLGLYPLSLVPLFIGPPMGILAHVYSLRNLGTASASLTWPGMEREASGAALLRTT